MKKLTLLRKGKNGEYYPAWRFTVDEPFEKLVIEE